MEEKQGNFSLNDILGAVKAYWRFLLKRWWLLTLIGLIGAAMGMIYYYQQKSKYEAVTTFILEDKSSSGGGLAGLASQFGLNIGSLNSGGSFFAGDNILNILKSKKIIQKVLLSQVDDTSQKNGQTLGDLYLQFTGIKKGWEKKPLLSNVSFVGVQSQLNPIQDSVLNVIYESLINNNISADRTSKQGSIIKVQVTSENSVFARLMSERLVQEASELYFDIKTRTAEANILQLQHRSDSLLVALNRKSFSAAASQPLDVNPAIRTAMVGSEIETRDKTVLATLYAEVVKNLEASKLILSQQTPVIQILDRPEYLMKDMKKGMKFWIAVFVAVFWAVFIAGAFFYFLRTAENGRYRRFLFL